MIIAALEAWKEENGSNKSSISKYFGSKFRSLLAGHSLLLSDTLNHMKESAELVFWKNNYMKSDQAPPHRGRGRPPKPKGSMLPSVTLSPARPRGHPPKDPDAPSKQPTKPKVTSSTGRPRGRPRNMAKPTGGLGGGSAETAAVATPSRWPRGRPSKVRMETGERESCRLW